MWMSHSSGERGRPRHEPSGGVRAQAEPLAALAAVFAVIVGLGIYVGGLHAAVPAAGPEPVAPTALDAAVDRTSDPAGVLAPGRLARVPDVAPAGHRVNATLTTADRQWRIGPPVPADATDRAARRVAVRQAPNRTVVGRLRVIVW